MPARKSPRYRFRPYAGRGRSGVTRYAFGPDYILVEFQSGDVYRYDYSAPGAHHVRLMQQLAVAGAGLATFITREVKGAFAEKIR